MSDNESDEDDSWYQPYYGGKGTQGTGNTSVPGSPYTQGVGAQGPTAGPSPADEDDEGGDKSDGDYECTACSWRTDIDNEHRSRPQHWCDECETIQRFEHDP